MFKTVSHLVASIWLLYGIHFDSWSAGLVGIAWTLVFMGEVIYMLFMDEKINVLSARADMTGSDYEPYESRR